VASNAPAWYVACAAASARSARRTGSTVSAAARLIATQRVQFYGSFNEVAARTAAEAGADVWFPWYDHASPGMASDEIHIVNPGSLQLAGTVTVGNPAVGSGTFSVGPGGNVHLSLRDGVIGGPVHVHANAPVLSWQRVQYYQTFNEVAGHPTADASTTLYFNWYDHASPGMLNDNLHLTNPSAAVVSGSITVGGASGGTMPFSLQPFAGAYVGLPPGHIGGPVTVSASAPVLASQRVQYYGSFHEVVGRPASAAVGLSEAAVNQRLSRARKSLAALLQPLQVEAEHGS